MKTSEERFEQLFKDGFCQECGGSDVERAWNAQESYWNKRYSELEKKYETASQMYSTLLINSVREVSELEKKCEELEEKAWKYDQLCK